MTFSRGVREWGLAKNSPARGGGGGEKAVKRGDMVCFGGWGGIWGVFGGSGGIFQSGGGRGGRKRRPGAGGGGGEGGG